MMQMMIAITINESTTSVLFQLALLLALSAATVVEKVSPFTFSSVGAGVNMLMTTNNMMLKMNRYIQKYKKFMVAN